MEQRARRQEHAGNGAKTMGAKAMELRLQCQELHYKRGVQPLLPIDVSPKLFPRSIARFRANFFCVHPAASRTKATDANKTPLTFSVDLQRRVATTMEEDEQEQEWIEAPEGWGEHEQGGETNQEDDDEEEESNFVDLFANKDPREYFKLTLKIDETTTKTLKLAGFQLDSDQVDQSTGVTLWKAAPRLATYLQNNASEFVKGRTVLELGAGLGLCGIAALFLGAQQVVMTDGDTKTLKQMRENVQEVCADSDAIECRQLLWGSPHMEKFQSAHGYCDTIMGADVIYTKSSMDPLFDTVACLLQKPNGRFILSRYNIWNGVSNEVVLEAAKQRNFEYTQPSEGIFVFSWK